MILCSFCQFMSGAELIPHPQYTIVLDLIPKKSPIQLHYSKLHETLSHWWFKPPWFSSHRQYPEIFSVFQVPWIFLLIFPQFPDDFHNIA